eukprot:Gb_31682 [translate_table: standard]
MDDMVWDEFQQSNDHAVPDPEDIEESTWTMNEKQWKKLHHQISNVSAKSTEQRVSGGNNVISGDKETDQSGLSNKEEPTAQSLNMHTWVALQDEELAATSYNSMHVDAATGIGTAKEGINGDCCKDVKLESVDNDLIIGFCKEDPLLEERDATVVNNSCHFSLTDISPPDGDLDLFGGEHKDETSNNILDYTWASIDDFEEVDNLFRSSESTLAQVMDRSSDELIWPSSSFSSVDDNPSKIVQQGTTSSSPKVGAPKGNSQQSQVKMECVPCGSCPFLVPDQNDDLKVEYSQQNDYILDSDKTLEQESYEHMLASQGQKRNENGPSCDEQRLDHCERSKETTGLQSKGPNEHTGVTYQYTDKVDSNLVQRGSSKQPEENDKKKFYEKKGSQNSPNIISYSQGKQFATAKLQTSSAPHVFPSLVQASQKTLGETNSAHVHPQVPYLRAGYGYPLHHVPVIPSSSNVRPQVQPSRPIFAAYQLPVDTSNQQQHIKRPFEIPCSPPVMTPQDKIEKLRLRQQMQHRLVVDHKHQKFDENASPDHSFLHKHPQKMHYQHTAAKPQEGADRSSQTSNREPVSLDNSSVGPGLPLDDDDHSLEATVLHHLQTSITRLDIGTRLCIRDALYRLARSAMQRHSASDIQSNSVNSREQIGTGHMDTSFSGYYLQTERCTGITSLETETNAIDRSVAHLLFHKHSLPTADGPLNVPEGTTAPDSCLWPSPALQASTWLGANPTAVMPAPNPGQVPTSTPESRIGAIDQNVTNVQGSSLSESCSASSIDFHSRVCDPLASRDLQYTEDIESVSKDKSAPQNSNYVSPDVKCRRFAQTSDILKNGECMLSQSVKEILRPNIGNQAKQETLENMEVDVCDTDVDVLTSGQSSEVGGFENLEAHINNLLVASTIFHWGLNNMYLGIRFRWSKVLLVPVSNFGPKEFRASPFIKPTHERDTRPVHIFLSEQEFLTSQRKGRVRGQGMGWVEKEVNGF